MPTLILRKPKDQIMEGAQQVLDSEQNETQDTAEAKPAKSVRRRMVRIKERRAADLKGA